jgi:hypothetical protein
MRRVLGAVSVLVAGLAGAPAAHATFPGRTDALAFAQTSNGGDAGPDVQRASIQVARLRFRNRGWLMFCERRDGVPTDGSRCTGPSFSSPSYSADGQRLVFDGGEAIGVTTVNGRVFRMLPAVTADDGDPAFSPDRSQIIFTGTNDRGSTDLYVRPFDGGEAQLIVHDASEPAWSSRGRIAYVRDGNVYSANANGGERRFVTSGVSPDWSPGGGRRLVVRPLPTLTFADPVGPIYVVSARGRTLQRIRGVRDASHPVWSPSGLWIAYEKLFAGVFAKPIGAREEQWDVAPSQYSGESGSITSFDPAWRPKGPGLLGSDSRRGAL